ncbi:MAG: sialidase [Bryobacteraceae bacterium]
MRRYFTQCLPFILILALSLSGFAQQRNASGRFGFRFLGPQIGNRIASVAGIPGDPGTYYAGAASGGIWKSTDGGNRFVPIFDHQDVAAIGALAVAPSQPTTVWAGTGEAWAIRPSDVMGDGIYKSTDGGKTWKHMGLEQTGRIGRILINPTNPDIVFACALGRTTGPQQNRGVFRTTDGGQHWKRVLFVDEHTGCSGLTLDPRNPLHMFAGMWQVEMRTYGEFGGGPGSGVYESKDSGTTWKHLTGHGLPKPPVGKIDVAIAPTDHNRVYALIQTVNQGSLWRSEDGGETWHAASHSRLLIGRAGYYIRLAVSPQNENEVLVADNSFFRSLDGGETFHREPFSWGGDTHDIWFDPKDANRFVITDDGGMNITTTNGRGFHHVKLPIGQMYHVAVDNRVPYWIYTNMQDDGTMRGPSVPGPEAYADPGDGWQHGLGGCESGFTLPDPTDPNIIWSSCYGDEVTRYDARTKEARSVSPWMHTLDSPPNVLKYRCHWTPPLAIDPFDHNTVYYGCQVIFKTSDAGQSWSVISPDLSTRNPKRIVPSGGLVGDNLGQFYGEVVYAIAPSKIRKGLIWAGTNDGKVWYTKDGGGHWTDVTKNITGMPPWGTISKIEPSHFDPGTAYISVDFHLMDNRDPYIYKTTNYGQTWKRINSDLPKGPLAYVNCVAEDPNHKGLLFAGTGNAFYYSLDDRGHWTHLQTGLPPSPVTWIVVQKHFHDVVVSTYGRGIYILDDITPLENMADHTPAGVTLYPSRSTYRFIPNGRAFLNFWLPSAASAQLAILDARGNVIRSLQGPAGKPGLNRWVWDLRYDSPALVKLRTAAPDNPFIWEEPRFRGKDWRPINHWGIEPAEVGPVVIPGKYSVRLTVNGHSYTQPIEILQDPRRPAKQTDLEASLQVQLRIRNDIDKVSQMVNRIEWMRKQLENTAKMLAAEKKEDQLKAAQTMDQKMKDAEYKLVSKFGTNSDNKYYSEPYKIYLNLIWLNGEVGTGAGDVAGGANFRPTDASVAVLKMIEKNLAAAEADYRNLVNTEVPAFNKSLAGSGIALPAAKPSAQ